MPGEERDPQRFWLTVPGELRQASARSALMQAVVVAPDLFGRTLMERLLKAHTVTAGPTLASGR
jgi:hypothetical protein